MRILNNFQTSLRGRWLLFLGAVFLGAAIAPSSLAQDVQFSSPTYSVKENGTNIVITVIRSGALTNTSTVSYQATTNGTARAGEDFTNPAGTLTFTNGQGTNSFTVAILNDGFFEGTETINLQLFNPVNANLGLANAIISLVDDDTMICLSTDIYRTSENETNVVITVTRSGGLEETTQVEFGTRIINITDPNSIYTNTYDVADSGLDYGGASGVLLFTNGQTSITFTIPILDDFNIESNEYFFVYLTNVIGGSFSTNNCPFESVVEIADNDNDDTDTMICLSTAIYRTSENETNVVITVTRSGGLEKTTQVEFGTRIIDITDTNSVYTNDFEVAESGSDYVGSFGVLLFTNGQTRITFTIPILDDFFTESNEYFFVYLTNVIGGSFSTNNCPFESVVEIADNDTGAPGAVMFTRVLSLGPSVVGSSRTLRVFVERVGGDSGLISIKHRPVLSLTNCPGSIFAQQGTNADFTGGDGMLTWDDGVSGEQFFEIIVLEDDLVELDEIIALELYDPVGGVAISPTDGTMEITINSSSGDDDQPAGAADKTYNPRTVLNPTPGANNSVYAIAVYFNGNSLLGGDFTGVNAVPRNRIARVFSDGGVDLSFNPGDGANDFVNAVVIQPNGRIIIAGGFTFFNRVSRDGIARLNNDGSLDNSFNPAVGVNGSIMDVALQSNGRILIGGRFSIVNGVSRNNIARLNADGTLDASFNPGTGTDGTVLSIALDSNSSLVIGGDFTTVNGISRNRIARLDQNGNLDSTFLPSGADNVVYAVKIQGDQKILVGGAFNSINGVPWNSIARLTTNGTLDAAFNPASGFNGPVYTIGLQLDGLPVIGGEFTTFNGTARSNVARLNIDGTLDTGFLDTYYNTAQPGTDQFVSAVAIETVNRFVLVTNTFTITNLDGTITTTNVVSTITFPLGVLIGGGFSFVGGGTNIDDVLPRFNFALLVGGSTTLPTTPLTNAPGNVEFVSATYSADENVLGGELAVTVRRVNGVLGSMQVGFATSDGSAIAGSNYIATAGTITWSDCDDLTHFFTIPIIDNSFVGGNTSFTITLSNAVGTGIFSIAGPALGFQDKATVVIVDNDFNRGTLGFSAPSFYVNEQAGTATITVTRTNGTTGAVSVQYATSNGSALSGSDYASRSNTLSFGPGETSKSFTVSITNDLSVEFEETINLTLSNPGGGVQLRPDGTNATIVIMDNDNGPGSLSFSTASFQARESNGTALITVRRTSGTTDPVAVDFFTFDGPSGTGSASEAIDYVRTNGTLFFPAGQTSATFTVTILPDSLVEGNELLNVILTNATGGSAIGFQSNAVVMIIGDDFSGIPPLAMDPTFDPGNGATNLVRSLAIQADGKIVLGGAFTNFDGVPRNFIARLNPDGPIDLAFNPGSGANGLVSSVGVQTNGRVVLGGAFSTINGVSQVRVGRLTTNGTVDSTFNQPTGLNAAVNVIALQPDFKIVIGGAFNNVNASIARLHTTGAIDPSFQTGAGANDAVFALAIQPDGKVLVGGSFTSVNGIIRNRLVRLNMDGTVDSTFTPGSGANGTIYAINLASDGRILIGGDFTAFNGVARRRVARLNADGTLDTTFDAGTGPNQTVFAVLTQTDGRVFIGGDFTSVNGITRNRIARLNLDGSLDSVFDPGTGADSTVYAMAFQPDGKLIIGGAFKFVNGYFRPGVARLNVTTEAILTFSFEIPVQSSDGSVRIAHGSQPGRSYVLEASTNLFNWSSVITNLAVTNRVEFTDTNAPAVTMRFYRARQVTP